MFMIRHLFNLMFFLECRSEVPSSVSNSRLLSHVSGIDVSDYHANESGGGTASPTSSGSSHVSVANYRFKAYAPRAFDFFRKIYKVDKAEFMVCAYQKRLNYCFSQLLHHIFQFIV